MDAGILPVKRLDAAKSRLDSLFDPGQRRELAAAMLEDALDLCARATFLSWHVLSADEIVLRKAAERGFETLEDPPDGGLNDSLASAIDRLSGADSVTIIPADTPLATASDLQDILDTGAISDVVVVPADRDAGTNGLYLSPPDLMAPRFGESSFSGYLRNAHETGLRCSILPLEGLALDIDSPEDIDELLGGSPRENRTVRLLQRWREGRS